MDRGFLNDTDALFGFFFDGGHVRQVAPADINRSGHLSSGNEQCPVLSSITSHTVFSYTMYGPRGLLGRNRPINSISAAANNAGYGCPLQQKHTVLIPWSGWEPKRGQSSALIHVHADPGE